MPQFELLGSLARDLHQEFVNMYYLLLPVFFSLAVVVAWFRNPTGSPEFLDIVKRAIIATILLVAFPDISKAILYVADGITERGREVPGRIRTVMINALRKVGKSDLAMKLMHSKIGIGYERMGNVKRRVKFRTLLESFDHDF